MEKAFTLTKDLRAAAVHETKVQTRRRIKDAVILELIENMRWGEVDTEPVAEGNRIVRKATMFKDGGHIDLREILLFAKYQVGDLLFLQEPYRVKEAFGTVHVVNVEFSDDGKTKEVMLLDKEWKLWRNRKNPFRKTSGRFMYKSLARHWFEVTGVGVERVRDISKDDAKAEGCETEEYLDALEHYMCCAPSDIPCSGPTLKKEFAYIWDSCYGDGAWDRNDWIFKTTFKKIERE